MTVTTSNLGTLALFCLFIAAPISAAPNLNKRNSCTTTLNPDCLPNYNYMNVTATVLTFTSSIIIIRALTKQYDDIPHGTILTTYNNLTYTGFRAVIQPLSKPHLIQHQATRPFVRMTVLASTRRRSHLQAHC